jgi:hypothetical protein
VIKDKIEGLDQSYKNKLKILRKYEKTCMTSETPSKDHSYESWA